jgi:signal transduction histidine kinase
MRWGVLANLALILLVSGVLLFVVFCASLERAAVDARSDQAVMLMDIVQHQILRVSSSDRMWEGVRNLCRARAGMRIALYDAQGLIVGGCGANKDLEKPVLSEPGRRVKVERWPTGLIHGKSLIVDSTGDFPHGIRSLRVLFEIPPSVFTPAWKFFAAYLVLTQGALFFLGYLLFHRTIIGPISDVANLAGRAAGVADFPDSPYVSQFKGDIQKIAASLRAVMVKILEDREKMEALIGQLQEANRDLEAAQQGLIRSEKLAGVGRLAAGLAHEIGNPLQIVMGYVELLQRQPGPESRDEILGRMDSELKRIHDILQRLLEFARPIRKVVQVCDVNSLVNDCGSLLKGRKGFRNLDFEFDLCPDLPMIKTEPEKIRQTLVNLIFNAADAIPESGGKIVLRTRKSDNGLEIQVQDTGSGISAADLEKVFDPFFTTKDPGKGTGLGLAVCLGLVESLGGGIDISSVEGRGTTVTVALPLENHASPANSGENTPSPFTGL